VKVPMQASASQSSQVSSLRTRDGTRLRSAIEPSGTCGSGWSEPWVRDSYGNANFTEPCRQHDQCYDTCGVSKDDCDSAFHGGLRDACRRAYSSPWHAVQRRACLEIANTYHSAVHRMGGDAYRAAQSAQGCQR